MKPIGLGDLVMVVKERSCCPQFTKFGYVFTVSSIQFGFSTRCPHCTSPCYSDHAQDVATGMWTELHRLIRIDPPAESQSTERERELTI